MGRRAGAGAGGGTSGDLLTRAGRILVGRGLTQARNAQIATRIRRDVNAGRLDPSDILGAARSRNR